MVTEQYETRVEDARQILSCGSDVFELAVQAGLKDIEEVVSHLIYVRTGENVWRVSHAKDIPQMRDYAIPCFINALTTNLQVSSAFLNEALWEIHFGNSTESSNKSRDFNAVLCLSGNGPRRTISAEVMDPFVSNDEKNDTVVLSVGFVWADNKLGEMGADGAQQLIAPDLAAIEADNSRTSKVKLDLVVPSQVPEHFAVLLSATNQRTGEKIRKVVPSTELLSE